MQVRLLGWFWMLVACGSLEGCWFSSIPRTPFDEGRAAGCEVKRRGGFFSERDKDTRNLLQSAYNQGWASGYADCCIDKSRQYKSPYDLEQEAKAKQKNCPPSNRKHCY